MKNIIFSALLLFGMNSHAQLGGLIKKAKEKTVATPTTVPSPSADKTGDDRKTQPRKKDAEKEKAAAVDPANPFGGNKYWTGGKYFTADNGISNEGKRGDTNLTIPFHSFLGR